MRFLRRRQPEVRVATWNLKQAVAPLAKPTELWAWLDQQAAPHIMVLTEAKVPTTGVPDGWQAQWREGGMGPRRRWGTVLAGRGVELTPVTTIPGADGVISLDESWPGSVEVADVSVDGRYWATVVGMYAATLDSEGKSCGHGRYTTPMTLRHLKPLFSSFRGERLILAGDFNVLPRDLPARTFERFGLVELAAHTAAAREPLAGCTECDDPARCGHMWTHRNTSGKNHRVQHIDFIFASTQLLPTLSTFTGGIEAFPDAWSMSDHAPLLATFQVPR